MAPKVKKEPEKAVKNEKIKKKVTQPAEKPAKGRGKKPKKKKMNPGMSAIFKILLIVFVSVAIIFIAARSIGGVTLTSVAGDIKVFFQSLGWGEGFPFKTTGEAPEQIFIDGSRIFVFSRDKTVLLSSSAKKISEVPIKYGNPAVDFKDGEALIYDRDSAKYRLQSTSETAEEREADGTVLAAALGKKGNYAAAVRNGSSVSTMKVFSKRNKQLFKYDFTGEKVTSIGLSDDGKYASVGTIFSKNAQINSKVYVFKFDSKDYISCFDFESSAVVSVEYDSSHNIEVIMNTGRRYIRDNQTLGNLCEFGSDILFKCSNGDDRYSAVALKKYGGDNFGTVKIFRGNKLSASVDVKKEIKDVYCTGSYTAVLTTNSVMIFKNGNGKLKKEIKADLSMDEIAVKGRRIYMMAPSEIDCVKF